MVLQTKLLKFILSILKVLKLKRRKRSILVILKLKQDERSNLVFFDRHVLKKIKLKY